MANICLYKIKVVGKKEACYKLIDMMPLYSGEKEIISEQGDDDCFELIFSGDCKWSVDCYTSRHKGIHPYTQEEIAKIDDGFGWEYPLIEKSILLDCDIYCNSKDIDDSGWAIYEHYNRGQEIKDECPKEIHIKRGRDYDAGDEIVVSLSGGVVSGYLGRCCKVRFESGAYYYEGNYDVGDIVHVDGAKKGEIGRVVEIEDKTLYGGFYKIECSVGHADVFVETDIENLWKSFKPVERKEWLKRLSLDETMTKKKFLSTMDYRWTLFAMSNNDWAAFVESLKI